MSQGNFYLYPLTGPASSTDNAIATYKGTGGRVVQNTSVTVNSGQIRTPNGTAAAPSFSFTSDTGTGAYRQGAASIGWAFAGVDGFKFLRSGAATLIQGAVGSGYLGVFDNGAVQITHGSGATLGFTSASGGFFTAAGTNQSITLTPSGTGIASITTNTGSQVTHGITNSGAGQTDWKVSNSGRSIYIGVTGLVGYVDSGAAATPLVFNIGGTEKARLTSTNGNLLLGGLTTDGTGVLQLPAATTSAGGITLGTDVNFFRSAAGVMTLGSTGAGSANGGLKLLGSDGRNVTIEVGPSGYARASGGYQTQKDGNASPASAYGIAFGDSGATTRAGIGLDSLNTGMVLSTGGTATLTLDSSQNATFAGSVYLSNAGGTSVIRTLANSLILQTNGAFTGLSIDTSQNVSIANKITAYNGIATAGNGVVTVQGAARATAQTAANASVATYTVGASDASFEVSANILVTTATTHAFTCTCAYTDEGNTARTITFTFSNVGGTFLTSIANTGGAVPYEGVPLHIRAKASTAITIATTGTFTSVVYNVEGNIRKIA